MFGSYDELRAEGFEGFLSVGYLRETKLADVPTKRGVYLVLRDLKTPALFLDAGAAGHFKGRGDPNVSIPELESNWVDGAIVVYIGKAGAPDRKATLRSRINQFLKFGIGKKYRHWGGRLTWQIDGTDDLVICWKQTLDTVPRDVKRLLISEFVQHYGQRPFANLQN